MFGEKHIGTRTAWRGVRDFRLEGFPVVKVPRGHCEVRFSFFFSFSFSGKAGPARRRLLVLLFVGEQADGNDDVDGGVRWCGWVKKMAEVGGICSAKNRCNQTRKYCQYIVER